MWLGFEKCWEDMQPVLSFIAGIADPLSQCSIPLSFYIPWSPKSSFLNIFRNNLNKYHLLHTKKKFCQAPQNQIWNWPLMCVKNCSFVNLPMVIVSQGLLNKWTVCRLEYTVSRKNYYNKSLLNWMEFHIIYSYCIVFTILWFFATKTLCPFMFAQ